MAARLSLKQLAEICRRTATSHAAGLDARTIWQREARSGSPTKRKVFQSVSQAVARGATLANALEETDGAVPQLMIDMVHVGEQSGRIDESLHRLGSYYEQVKSIRSAFLIGIAWPAIQMVIAILILGLVIWVMGMIDTGDMDVDMLGLGLKGAGGALTYFAVVGVLFVLGYVLVQSLLKGKLSAHVMAGMMRLPGLGRSLQVMAMSRLAWALGMTIESGMAADKSAEIALRSTQNQYFIQHLEQVVRSIARGDGLYDAFAGPGVFSEEFLDAVAIGEETGKLGESMDRLSQHYEEQGKVAMRALAVVGGVVVWMMVAAFIIFFIFRIAFFYFGLLDDLMRGNF